MSSGFDQFVTKKKSSNALINLLRNTFLVGMQEMSKQISYLFWSPQESSKHQIDQTLYEREQELKNQRMH